MLVGACGAGVMATPNGFGPLEANPTGTVAITVLLAVSMTETVLELSSVT
jgi:hypothetical protein